MDKDTYPDVPGYRKGSPATSRAAAESMIDDARTIRAKVLAFVASASSDGATGDDVAAALDLHVTQVRSRLSELHKGGKIVASGRTRLGCSGRQTSVWVLPQFGPEPDEQQLALPVAA